MRRGDGAAPFSITIRVDEKLAGLTPNGCCIFRVHTLLRKVNEKAYEPQLLAIGPYHRGKDDLRFMEEVKLRYLQLLLQRRNEDSVETYIKDLKELEESAREFYAEPISLTSDEFVEMMLLDGFYIIELLRKFARTVSFDISDLIFQLDGMLNSVERDLLLYENQIPFFLLAKLFQLTRDPSEKDDLFNLAKFFFRGSLLEFGGGISSHEWPQNISHLLDFFHKSVSACLSYVRIQNFDFEYGSIPSATELQEAGVKLKKLESGRCFFDVRFDNGVLRIPPLEIEDRSESIFRNLIAYEIYSDDHPKYFRDYVRFMDNLINYPKDVELLRQQGIIKNLLGDDEAVSTMFDELGGGVSMFNFFYNDIFRDVNKYYSNKQWGRLRNVWMNKYFRSAWAFISSLAAAFLLLLTLTQTIFSVLSYFVPMK